ncbi:hypothetical protein SAMN06264365_10493 [Actinoplanes regularis]|uniref:Uncharacterized protein n=1 Tax=Actinoplanes regularis TaxID=52697 RepID=A0A238Y040_9ACTN|nr:hypothetical protein Are01nite_28410 [Actinoplanes regularis]SNR63669.1 hypothetical protein SAMN06264365_10493 [Actinoplanes regularis]
MVGLVDGLPKTHILTVVDTAGQVSEPIQRGFTDAAGAERDDRSTVVMPEDQEGVGRDGQRG